MTDGWDAYPLANAAPPAASDAWAAFPRADAPIVRPGQAVLEGVPYIGPAIGALNAATTKSQDWFAPTKFLNSVSNPILDWSGTANKDIKAAESTAAESEHPIASAVGAGGGALMNLPTGRSLASAWTMPLARTGAATIGGALGGASQGNSASERAENALYGGGAGLALGLGGEGLQYGVPLLKPALRALQTASIPAYLAAEHYADWFKENVMRHAPAAGALLVGLLGAPYLAPKAGEMAAPNRGAQGR